MWILWMCVCTVPNEVVFRSVIDRCLPSPAFPMLLFVKPFVSHFVEQHCLGLCLCPDNRHIFVMNCLLIIDLLFSCRICLTCVNKQSNVQQWLWYYQKLS